MNINNAIKECKTILPKLAEQINWENVKKALPYGLCVGLLVTDYNKSKKQNEKDLLYKKKIQSLDAEVADLKNEANKTVERVNRLEEINHCLVDVINKQAEASV